MTFHVATKKHPLAESIIQHCHKSLLYPEAQLSLTTDKNIGFPIWEAALSNAHFVAQAVVLTNLLTNNKWVTYCSNASTLSQSWSGLCRFTSSKDSVRVDQSNQSRHTYIALFGCFSTCGLYNELSVICLYSIRHNSKTFHSMMDVVNVLTFLVMVEKLYWC